ncbi:hypothetical protein PENSPDRAFT_590545, partial [Peniophora sp. CONT]
PLKAFFARFRPSFVYDPNIDPTKQFRDLCHLKRWCYSDKRKREDWLPEHREADDQFRNAMAQQFNVKFGMDVNSLDSWQALCKDAGVSPIPSTLRECRKAVVASHVNLVDLLSARTQLVRRFSSEEELAEYTRSSKKYFPIETAYHSGILYWMLRQINNKYEGYRNKAVRRPRARSRRNIEAKTGRV